MPQTDRYKCIHIKTKNTKIGMFLLKIYNENKIIAFFSSKKQKNKKYFLLKANRSNTLLFCKTVNYDYTFTYNNMNWVSRSYSGITE